MGEDWVVGDTETPTTPAGRYLQQRMNDLGYKTKADLANAADVSPSTITRLFKRAEYRPDIDVMRRLARGLHVEHDDLVAAIYGETAVAEPAVMHPLAAELARMLAVDSPLSDPSRQTVEVLVDRAIEPSRREMRTGQPSGIQIVGVGAVGSFVAETVVRQLRDVDVAEVLADEPGPESYLIAHTRERVHRLLDPDGPLDAKTRYTLQAAIANILDLVEKPPNRAEDLRGVEREEMFQATMAALNERQQRDPAFREEPAER